MSASQTDSSPQPSDHPNRQLTVNAAFLKDIKDDNRELKSLFDRLQPMTSHPEIALNHWSEIAQLIADLRDQLAFHFSLEEAYGYFDDAIAGEPQLSLAAHSLRSQHGELFEQVRQLADAVSDTPTSGIEPISVALKQFNAFRQKFEQHEESELKLILQALDDDLGVGD